VLASACGFHFSADGIAATKETIEKTIDVKMPTMFHQMEPNLPLGHAHCPEGLMEFQHGKVGHCTFDVGMISIPLSITMDAQHRIQYTTDASFFDMDHLESYVQSQFLQLYAVHATIECGYPRYRVLKPGSKLSCEIHGANLPASVELKIMDNGTVFVYNPPGLKTPGSEMTQPLIKEHLAGHAVIVRGDVVERIFDVVVRPAFQANAASQHMQPGSMSCPATVDLSADKRAICVIEVMGKQLRISFWIQGRDWRAETLDDAFSRSSMEAAALKYYSELVRDNGISTKIAVHCPGPEVFVVTPPAKHDCDIMVGHDRHRLTLNFTNRDGRVSYYVWPLGQ
jgi:hypothetical protein